VNDRREEILRAATILFNERGYDRTSMGDIGEAVGMSGPALYHYFTGKEQLLAEQVSRSVTMLGDLARPAQEPGLSDLEQLERLVRAYAHGALTDYHLIGLWLINSKVLDRSDRARWGRAQRIYREEWVHALNSVRPELSDAECRVLVTAAFGAFNTLTFYRSGLPAAQEEELLYQGVMTMLLHSPVPDRAPSRSRRATARPPLEGNGATRSRA
jgi:AcrR family transcriptional regulator